MLPKDSIARAVFVTSLVVGLLLRGWVALFDDGIYWPDEVYQSLEPAHWVVFGYGLRPWEFIEGARNWTLPGFVTVVMKLCAVLGLDRPAVYVRVIKVVFALLAVVAGRGVYGLARALGASELASALGMTLWLVCAPAVYFGPRAMSENASATAIIVGLWLVLEATASSARSGGTAARVEGPVAGVPATSGASYTWLVLGASLLGLSVLLRLQSAVFPVGVVLVLVGRAVSSKQWRALAVVMGVLSVWAVLYGATDALAWHDAPQARWGGWFHSADVYVRYNLIEKRGSHWGTAPARYYFDVLWSSMPGVTVVMLAAVLASLRRAWAVAAMVLVSFGIFSTFAHKEYRFIVPLLPALFALAAVGLTELPLELQTWLGLPVVLGVVGWSAARAPQLTFGDLGAYPERPTASAWDDYGHVNRLMMLAGQRPDLCGLRIDVAYPGGVGLAWTGGSTYLHRSVPLYSPGYPVQYRHFNYAIVPPGSQGAELVAKDRDAELVRIPGLTCEPDPGFAWRLP